MAEDYECKPFIAMIYGSDVIDDKALLSSSVLKDKGQTISVQEDAIQVVIVFDYDCIKTQ